MIPSHKRCNFSLCSKTEMFSFNFIRHPCSDWKLCLPYYNMAGITLKDALQKASNINEKDQVCIQNVREIFINKLTECGTLAS